jgi:hypothetical protein
MISLTNLIMRMKALRNQHLSISNIFIFFSVLFFFAAQTAPSVSALSSGQKKLYNQNINYYDLDGCAGGGGEITEGSGGPKGATFPNLSPEAMAKGINKYIKSTNPNSKMKNLGKTIVAGAKKSNISPFLIVAIAQVESGIGDPNFGDGFNVREANNSFGRSATSSQPHVQGEDRLWYKWSSIKASVDPSAHENKNASGGGDIAAYIRNEYKPQLEANDFDALFLKYAPEFENDTQGYIKIVKNGIDKMVNLTNKSSGSGVGSFVAPTTDSCCPAGGSVGSLTGSNNAERAFNYFVGRGLPAIVAAGLVGNFQQESGEDLDTNADNGTHKGIAQWEDSRWANLVESADGKEYELIAQLSFVIEELNGGYKSVLNSLKNAADSDEAAKIVFENYEIAGDDTLPKRQAYARQLMNQFGGGGGSAIGSCTGSSADAAAVAQQAIELAWPDASHGITPKPSYADAIKKYNEGQNPADCGVFVSTVMRSSGADPDYPPIGTSVQEEYVRSNPDKYDVVDKVNSTSELQPGDILIVNQGAGQGSDGHTYIFVGKQPPNGYNQASASLNSRAGNLGDAVLSDSRGDYIRARLK